MGQYVQDADVREIIEVEDEDTDLTPWIRPAEVLVNAVCVPLGYAQNELVEIARYLSAHFYRVHHPALLVDRADVLQDTIESKVDLRLQVTREGQQALLLDYKGGLASLNVQAGRQKIPITITWLGREDCW